jgi:hypothetical protein
MGINMGVEQPLGRGLFGRRIRWFTPVERVVATGLLSSAKVTAISAASIVALATALVGAFVMRPGLSYALFLPLVVAAGLLLRGRLMIAVVAYVCLAFLLVAVVLGWSSLSDRLVSSVLAVAATVAIVLLINHARTRAGGLSQQVAATMLTDLRRRHAVQTHMPSLPSGWALDTAVLPAHGEAFCGDVVVGCEVKGKFNAAVLDVSGKGSTAASRAVLLGGAVSGLIGALEPGRVLPATNDYLVRQGWTDGFATATHVAVDLDTGDFCLGSAGHPAAVQFHAGTGRWEPLRTGAGVVLGILEDLDETDYPRLVGRLGHGDVLVLYSDGVVEHKDVDIAQGIDRMLGVADREITASLEGSARRICEMARAGESDDRTVVVLKRN